MRVGTRGWREDRDNREAGVEFGEQLRDAPLGVIRRGQIGVGDTLGLREVHRSRGFGGVGVDVHVHQTLLVDGWFRWLSDAEQYAAQSNWIEPGSHLLFRVRRGNHRWSPRISTPNFDTSPRPAQDPC